MPNNVSRTAKDALKAKYSAACECGYDVLPGSPSLLVKVYRQLLSSMVQKVFGSLSSSSSSSEVVSPGRQTPLVNVGYAMRVSTILQTILSFVKYHQNNDCNMVQLVLLGAGLDVTGLWSMLLPTLQEEVVVDGGDITPACSLRVIEIDTSDICQVKKEALCLFDVIQVDSLDDTISEAYAEGFILSATAQNKCGQSGATNVTSSTQYVLLEIDLRDLDRVQRVLSHRLDEDKPTLFVSELVLAYLDESQANQLLQWCAHYVERAHQSALVAWETMGPQFDPRVSDQFNHVQSVVEGYKVAYFKQFTEKLHRGYADLGGASDRTAQIPDVPIATTFHPLECSTSGVERRLSSLGFVRVNACIAGVAVNSYAPLGHWTSRELFDEHAALSLHLRSYVFVCAFGDNSSLFLHQVLCPWTTEGCLPVLKHFRKAGGLSVWICKIEKEDERQVRELFLETYNSYAAQHRAIRKMVKTALRNDLASKAIQMPAVDAIQQNESSSIHMHYRSQGGFFLVAVQAEKTSSAGRRRVLGAIGIQALGSGKELSASGVVVNGASHIFEIRRLMVDSTLRGQGIGASLLKRVEEIIGCNTKGVLGSCLVLATTPTLLESANTFYASNGFTVCKEVLQGELMLRTYSKTLPANDQA